MQLLFGISLILASFLLFSSEFMLGKILLPLYGGTPMLWNTCMVFFQIALLVGYTVTHFIVKSPSIITQGIAAISIGTLASLVLEFSPAVPDLSSMSNFDLLFSVLWNSTTMIGLAFVFLASLSVLVQRWYAHLERDNAQDPYFLYASGNIGSAFALVAYPVLIEPNLSIIEQVSLWRFLFILNICLVVTLFFYTAKQRLSASTQLRIPPTTGDSLPRSQIIQWMILAMIPSGLIIAVTGHLSQDISAFPLLWTAPLLLYLLSFVLSFAETDIFRSQLWKKAARLGVPIVFAACLAELGGPVALVFPLYLLVFFIVCMALHVKLYESRPAIAYLSLFYLSIAAGGALGGIFCVVVMPAISSTLVEMPLLLVLALIPSSQYSFDSKSVIRELFRSTVPACILTISLLCIASFFATELTLTFRLIALMPAMLFCHSRSTTGWKHFLACSGIALGLFMMPWKDLHVLMADRTYFGSLKVYYDSSTDSNVFLHGQTRHGLQKQNLRDQCHPASYYHPSGPVGEPLEYLLNRKVAARVFVAGLGAGSLACYARESDRWTFVEIDPLVARIAQSPQYFTFLQNSPARESNEILIDDGRLAIGKQPDSSLDILILDVYSSDALPMHMFTKEAFALYKSKLKPEGVILVHASNQYIRSDFLGPLAQTLQRKAFIKYSSPTTAAAVRNEGIYASTWVTIPANSQQTLQSKLFQSGWREIPTDNSPLWTDDYSNLLSALTWW